MYGVGSTLEYEGVPEIGNAVIEDAEAVRDASTALYESMTPDSGILNPIQSVEAIESLNDHTWFERRNAAADERSKKWRETLVEAHNELNTSKNKLVRDTTALKEIIDKQQGEAYSQIQAS